jgi:putative MATE family efflux protein
LLFHHCDDEHAANPSRHGLELRSGRIVLDKLTRNILDGQPLPLIFMLTAPNALAFTVQAFVNIAEIWLIGTLGTVALAAIALSFPFSILIQTMSLGALGGGVSSAVARALGNDDKIRADRVLWHAIYLGIIISAVFALLFWLLGRNVLTLDAALGYCTILFIGGTFLWLSSLISAIFRGAGDMAYPSRIMIIASVLQVPLTALFIFGAFGLPALGVPGAALSNVVISAGICLAMLLRIKSGKCLVGFRKSCMAIDASVFREILKVSLPATLNPILNVAVILFLTALVGRFGPSALAGFGIGTRIEYVVLPIMFAFGTAATTLVGTNIGAGNHRRAEMMGWYAAACASLFCGLIGIVLALSARLWVPIFTSDPIASNVTTSYIQIVGPAFSLYAIGLVLYFASQGAAAMKWPIRAQIIRSILIFAAAWTAVDTFGMGTLSIFVVSTMSFAVYAGVVSGAVYLGAWDPHKVKESRLLSL